MTEKAQKKLDFLKSEYHKYDVCMYEMLDDCCADGLTIGEAFEVYIEAMRWSDGDTFYKKQGGFEELEEL